MRNILLYISLALSLNAFAVEHLPSDNKTVKISKNALYDKIKGGWAGKTIGCTYGGPIEFTQNGTMIQDYTPIKWSDNRVQWYFDNFPGLYDDLYVDIVFVNVIDRLGYKAPADSFAISFANAGFPLWHANQAAKYNITHGIMPPESGNWLNNPHADDIDYQIESDFAGLMSPGMPNVASDISDKVGHIFNYGDGWYGGVFVGALYSMAFVNNNMEEVVEGALNTIPKESDFYKCVNQVLECYRKDPLDWKYAWYLCQKNWSSEVGCPDGVFLPLDIDAKINSAYVAIGLLYGGNDFFKTIDISARCGQDSDCNASTSAGVLGTFLGYSNIPTKWTDSLKGIEDSNFAYTNISLNKLYKLSFNHSLDMIKINGGSVKKNDAYIKCQVPQAVRYEKSFDGHYPVEKIANNISLDNHAELDFSGIGFVQRGYVKCADKNYEAQVDLYIDGKLVEQAKLPAATDNSIDNRRVDLFYKYQLNSGKHHVEFKWNNKKDNAQVMLTEALIYSDKSNVKY